MILTRLFSYIGKYKREYIAGFILTSFELLIGFVSPYLYKQLTIVVMGDRSKNTMLIVIGLFISLLMLTPLVAYGTYVKQRATTFCSSSLRKAVFEHIIHMPVKQAFEIKTGDYMQRLTSDVTTASNVFQSYATIAILKFTLYTTIPLVILINSSLPLAATAIILSVLSAFFSTAMKPKVRLLEANARAASASLASYYVEALRNLPIIKVFFLYEILKQGFTNSCDIIYKKRLAFRTLNGIMYSLVYLFGTTAQPIGFTLGILYLQGSGMQVPDIVFAASLIAVMSDGMESFNSFFVSIQPPMVAAKRVFHVLDAPLEADRGTVESFRHNAPAVEFKNVSFSYTDGKAVLDNISFKVAVGETVAIVGGSGGGKTTILKLIQDFYDVDSGSISLFGTNTQHVSKADIRKMSAYVSQESTMIEGTAYENIEAGRQGASLSDVIHAAEKANIHNVIMTMPNEYDTFVGERGNHMSGGQKQRVGIARAFLKDAPILLLDEATAALDSASEAEVYKGLESLIENKTVIVVAHRLSTIQNADRIIVLEKGRIVEEGMHEELFELKGRYWQLWSVQMADKQAAI